MKNSSPLRGKPSTGEPDAGDPHVRFGGRGGVNQCVVPTPIQAPTGHNTTAQGAQPWVKKTQSLSAL